MLRLEEEREREVQRKLEELQLRLSSQEETVLTFIFGCSNFVYCSNKNWSESWKKERKLFN